MSGSVGSPTCSLPSSAAMKRTRRSQVCGLVLMNAISGDFSWTYRWYHFGFRRGFGTVQILGTNRLPVLKYLPRYINELWPMHLFGRILHLPKSRWTGMNSPINRCSLPAPCFVSNVLKLGLLYLQPKYVSRSSLFPKLYHHNYLVSRLHRRRCVANAARNWTPPIPANGSKTGHSKKKIYIAEQ